MASYGWSTGLASMALMIKPTAPRCDLVEPVEDGPWSVVDHGCQTGGEDGINKTLSTTAITQRGPIQRAAHSAAASVASSGVISLTILLKTKSESVFSHCDMFELTYSTNAIYRQPTPFTANQR